MTNNTSGLQHVNGDIFYHLHNPIYHDDQWFVGNEIISDGKRYNPFYDFYSHYAREFVLFNQSCPIQALSASVENLQKSSAFLDVNIRELINLPARLSEVITDLTVCLREEHCLIDDVAL